MNKKGTLDTAVYFMVAVLFIILAWIYLVNPILQSQIPGMITTNNITGIQAFVWYNLNLFFFITMFLFVLGYWAFIRPATTRRYPGQ